MNIDLLIKNTKRLAQDYNLDIPVVEKLNLLELINENLEELKKELDAEKYEKELGTLDRSVAEKLQKVTDPDFFSQIIEKIQNILKNYKAPSKEVLSD